MTAACPPPAAAASQGARAVLRIPSDLESLPRVRRFVHDMGERFCPGLAPADLERLVLATHEAAANIVLHGRVLGDDPTVDLTLEATAEAVRVSLEHDGVAFVPDGVSLPSVEEFRESGYGLHLIHRCVDEVRYLPRPGARNCTQLIIYRRKGKST